MCISVRTFQPCMTRTAGVRSPVHSQADLTFPVVEGATTPQFLLETGANVYGNVPAHTVPLFDCDGYELYTTWQALREASIMPAGINLCDRGAIRDGSVFHGYVKLAAGSVNVFMPIGGHGQPCYRNRSALALAP